MRILLVEDAPTAAQMLAIDLREQTHAVDVSADGEAALYQASVNDYDLVILDIMLPRKDGFEVCRELRTSGLKIPILMLTARDAINDRVTELDTCADDYLTKPFEVMELLARIEALLRRSPKTNQSSIETFHFGTIVIDFRQATVEKDNQQIELSALEFKLLQYLIEHRGKVIKRNELLDEVWGYNAMPSTRTVDVHIAWLRQKLEENPRYPNFIQTVHGLGYKFVG